MDATLQTRFEALCNQLSPENLCCDGELSPAQVRARRASINREWRELEKEAGRKVTQEEIA